MPAGALYGDCGPTELTEPGDATDEMDDSGEGAPCGGDAEPGPKPTPPAPKLTLCGMLGSCSWDGGWKCSREWPGANSLCRGTSTGGSTAGVKGHQAAET